MKDAVMTRRHFEFAAAMINSHSCITPEQRLEIARDWARAFEGTNKGFKRDMFINAATKRDLQPRGR